MASVEQSSGVDNRLYNEICRAYEVVHEEGSPVKPTRLDLDEELSQKYNAEIWFASEIHQRIKAYKIRGAYNFVSTLSDEQMAQGLVTASAGNHAQGIALSCNIMGLKAHIFMPKDTPENKVRRAKELGGEAVRITLFGRNFDESAEMAQRYKKVNNLVYAPPFDNRRVIAGQGTWGLEIANKLPNIDRVFCQAGGGGLIAGVSTAVKQSNPLAKIYGIEPIGAASLSLAMKLGKPAKINDDMDTLVDGASVRKVGKIPFRIASSLIEREVLLVENNDLRQAVFDLWNRDKPLKAEFAGALAYAGMISYLEANREEVEGQVMVCTFTGGNLSKKRFKKDVKTPLELLTSA